MKYEANVKGITFRVKDDPNVRKMIPDGEVELRHVPFVHEHDPNRNDPNAVEVWCKGHQIGFLGKGSNERKGFFAAIAEGADIKAVVTDFSYAQYDENLNMIEGTFNDIMDGYLGSVIIEFESAVTETHYTLKGKDYIRATVIAGMIDTVGFLIPKHLYNWMVKKLDLEDGYFGGHNVDEEGDLEFIPNTHEEYLEKIEKVRQQGISLHNACEEYAISGALVDGAPHGLKEFFTQYSVERISSEEIIKRGKKYRVAGRYDLFTNATNKKGERVKVIIDWKRSGTLKLSHMLQGAWYMRCKKADEFWVVLWGTKNKCGYSVKPFTKKDAAILNKVFDALAKIAYDLQAFKQFKLFNNDM